MPGGVMAMQDARALSLRLVEDLTDEQARRVADPAFSPLGWHLGHVAWQEERWLQREAWGRAPLVPEYDDLFDSFRSPKATRSARLPPLDAIRAYAARVRVTSLELAEREGPSPLLRDGWVFRFLANHERQHAETMALVRLLARLPLPGPFEAPRTAACSPGWIEVPAGEFVMGADDPEGWDNERPAHPRALPAFRIARRPVTNAEWLAFMEAGGYRRRSLWSEAGWAFVQREELSAPLHWEQGSDGAWMRFSLRGLVPVEPDHPVAHVSWYEAEAFARFAGARLPSEAEWERAAGGVPKRRWPCGGWPERANLGLRCGDTTPADGAFEGNVWEWTSSAFAPYPGFRPGPYRGYSAPWFDGRHRVLRGGSHLTHPLMARTAFRNWLEPTIRAYPAGLRLARDLSSTNTGRRNPPPRSRSTRRQ
ncbi:MAG TPA: ergothioneine biosynthesis protein EgtB [Fredinandcohnia sp.]|nr:ergothioneine biosynthesis protein EgtB [Fredinandcohnia sp.]